MVDTELGLKRQWGRAEFLFADINFGKYIPHWKINNFKMFILFSNMCVYMYICVCVCVYVCVCLCVSLFMYLCV